jgi:SAM-dependent methyltransferase
MLSRLRGGRSVGDFNLFLHELRSRELERLPRGADTVVHGGAAGSWYFDWFGEHYPTQVRHHVGVEAFAARPDGLGDDIEWLMRSLGNLDSIRDGEADLVFAGQVIEHLWPEEVVGFLLESHRILRPGGTLAIDSPNRRVTTAIDWEHPEHTVEFRPDEIVELAELAGFVEARVRGVWLCFDRERNRFLPLDRCSRTWPAERRAAEATGRPDDSFVWWLEARRAARDPDANSLDQRVRRIYESYRRSRFARLKHAVGSLSGVGEDRVVATAVGEAGFLVYGPYVPMRPGHWKAHFRVAAGPSASAGSFVAVDVAVGGETIARKEPASELPLDGVLHEVELPFELGRAEPSVEFRVQSNGALPVSALLHVAVERVTYPGESSTGATLEAARA